MVVSRPYAARQRRIREVPRIDILATFGLM